MFTTGTLERGGLFGGLQKNPVPASEDLKGRWHFTRLSAELRAQMRPTRSMPQSMVNHAEGERRQVIVRHSRSADAFESADPPRFCDHFGSVRDQLPALAWPKYWIAIVGRKSNTKSKRRFNPRGPSPAKRPTWNPAACSFLANSFGRIKSAGSWVPRGSNPITFSPTVTIRNEARRVLLIVSNKNMPLGRRTRRTSESTRWRGDRRYGRCDCRGEGQL